MDYCLRRRIALKISKIELSWFRGAAEQALLETEEKSIVVYGDTASGKSSFVDAVEYIISNGKIEHLRHEYSDRDYRNCIRNTVTPVDITSSACIYFDDGNYVKVEVPAEERVTFEGSSPETLDTVQNWGVLGHILRQDEISDFIKSTKSEKYSVLSPLLGLYKYEESADNINNILDSIIRESNYEDLKGQFNIIDKDINKYFSSMSYDEIKKIILSRALNYIDVHEDEDIESISNKIISKLEELSKKLEPDIKRYTILEGIHKVNFKVKLEAMIASDEELAKISDLFIDLKLNILENTSKILDRIDDLSIEIECPACGRNILGSEFKDHVDNELELLKKSRELKSKAIKNRGEIISSLSQIRNQYKSDDIFIQWLSLPKNEKIFNIFKKLEEFKEGELSSRWDRELIIELNKISTELYSQIKKELETEPPSMGNIIRDHDFFQTALKIPTYTNLSNKIKIIDEVISDFKEVHKKIREKISEITSKTLRDITQEIRRIWGKIHPRQLIEDIELIPSTEKDKALDINLKFYGKNQSSPRLTLSEGYRNSLGLSIFLALANKEPNKNHPIFLDDIISSLDREHRGMIADILRDELVERQTFLFTHDREWFDELKNRLSIRTWKFYTLQKWTSPENGIQLIPTHYTFEEAESFLPNYTNACGNAIRAIMDTELPKIALKLQVPMPYLQGIQNDYRTCTEFLDYIISRGQSKFKINRNGNWDIYQNALDCTQEVKELLITWANRASHGGSLTVTEAERLIEVSKEALNYFNCPKCGSKIWKLTHPDYVRCDCGLIRWNI